MRRRFFRPARHHPAALAFPGWRILLPLWFPRYERFYDINVDEFCWGVTVPAVSLSCGRNGRAGYQFGVLFGSVPLSARRTLRPVPWLASA